MSRSHWKPKGNIQPSSHAPATLPRMMTSLAPSQIYIGANFDTHQRYSVWRRTIACRKSTNMNKIKNGCLKTFLFSKMKNRRIWWAMKVQRQWFPMNRWDGLCLRSRIFILWARRRWSSAVYFTPRNMISTITKSKWYRTSRYGPWWKATACHHAIKKYWGLSTPENGIILKHINCWKTRTDSKNSIFLYKWTRILRPCSTWVASTSMAEEEISDQ